MATSKYAWVIAFLCFLAGVTFMTGIMMYAYNVSFIAEGLGVSVEELAMATSLFGALSTGCAFIAGMVGNKIGPRLAMGGGMLGMGILFVLIGLIVNDVMTFIILYAFSGVFGATLTASITPKLIASWFAPNMRAKGMMINTLGGSGVGALFGIILPIFLLNFGWEGCFEIMGVVIIVFSVIFFLLCRNTPESVGTHAFGATEEQKKEYAAVAAVHLDTKTVIKQVLKMKITWIYGISYIFWTFYFTVSNAFQTPAILACGYDITTAGFIGTCTMICLMISQALFSSLSDKFLSRKTIMGLMAIGNGAMQFGLMWILLAGVDIPILIVYVCILGLITGHAALLNTMMAEVYPPSLRAVGPGVISTIAIIGTFFGPLIGAAFVGFMGGQLPYAIPFAGAMLIISGLMIFFMFPKTGGKYGDPMADKEAAEILAAKQADAAALEPAADAAVAEAPVAEAAAAPESE